ncbi:MAG: hypothetical protein RR619_01435 [Raoultibacter sp.]
MKKVVVVVAVLVLALALVGCGGGMDAKSEKAYDLIAVASEGFKDPSSVRVVSGDFYPNDKGEESLCVVLAATNSYGAHMNDPYQIDKDGSALCLTKYADALEKWILIAKTKDVLDCDAINKKLEQKWKSLG